LTKTADSIYSPMAIEEKKAVGLDLEVMRPLLEGLLKNMEGGVLITNLDKKIIAFNKAAEWITGYCLDEVLNKPCSDFLKCTNCETACPFDKIMKTGIPANLYGVVIKTKDGHQAAINVTLFQLNDVHKKPRGMTAIFRDITELRSLREQLLQSEKLAVMGQLAASVAHEVNNPINGIINYIHIFLRRLNDNKIEVETWKKDLKLVERETIRIGRIVKNLLNFSRKTEPDLRPILIPQLFDETLPLIEDQFLIKNVSIKKNYGISIPEILGDVSQLQQVIINLMLNAVQAVDKKGCIEIGVAAEGARGSECFVRFDIADNGVGIPPEDMDKLYDPFFTTKMMDKGGIGLGLTIVQQIVKSHRGRISIKSQPGEGTTVSVRFPTL